MELQCEIFFIVDGKEIAKDTLTPEEQRKIQKKLKDKFMRECGYQPIKQKEKFKTKKKRLSLKWISKRIKLVNKRA